MDGQASLIKNENEYIRIIKCSSNDFTQKSKNPKQVPLHKFKKLIKENTGTENVCEYFVLSKSVVRPYFDVDCNEEIDENKVLQLVLDKLKLDFNTEDFSISSDHRCGKISFHIILKTIKIHGNELINYIDNNKESLRALHVDIKPYASSGKRQLWKTLYQPKPKDNESNGMRPINCEVEDH